MLTAPSRIEIVGVAGSGKSTLTRTLHERYAGFRIGDSLHTRVPSHWPYVAHSVPRLLPLVVRTVRNRPALSWDELKFVMYVLEWNRFLRSAREYHAGVTVLDQGPIFALACLLWGQKPMTRSEPFQAWVNEMLERWSFELDAIVWLVAPDHVLLERINSREQRHAAKEKSVLEGLELINLHRRSYGQLLDQVVRLGRPRLLCFDTSVLSAVEIAGELAEIFEAQLRSELTDAHPHLNVG